MRRITCKRCGNIYETELEKDMIYCCELSSDSDCKCGGLFIKENDFFHTDDYDIVKL